MMKHLSSHEIVDAVETDGALAGGLRAHLESCGQCRRQVDELREVLTEARTVDAEVPEPSPLFWSHFQARVRAATSAAVSAGEARQSWWQGWRTIVLVSASAAAVVLAAFVSRGGFVDDGEPAEDVVASALSAQLAADPADADGDAVWSLVVQMAQDVPVEDLQRVTTPRPGAADSLVEVLSLDERAELVRLLKAEMGGGE